jgi:ankyrin repeat protein
MRLPLEMNADVNADVNVVGGSGRTPLLLACERDCVDLVPLLM